MCLTFFQPYTVAASAQIISLNITKGTITEVFKAIEDQSEYKFFYNDNQINLNKRVDVNIHEESIEQVLNNVFRGTDITYKIVKNHVVLTNKTMKDTELPSTNQNRKRLTGQVVGQDGEPLIGVNVVVKGTTIGSMTDMDGNYILENVPSNATVEFSYIGYQKNVVLVNGRKDIPIKMEPLTSELKEVTVVGYGTQRKASVIGAITGLPVGKINRSVNKLSNVLAGQMAGVVAVQRSGEPGEGSDFWIRGVSTFGANNRPLVLVDGIERDLNLVDPEDIETFSILKDATATAIYGVRGANGVVLITTRKGKEGSKPVISARAEFSILQPTKMPKMANAQEFMEMYNFAYADNKNGEEFYSPEAMAKYLNGSDPDLYPNINWMDEIYKNSTTSERVNINVTGGQKR